MAETKSLATQSVQKNVAAIHIKAELTLTQRKMVNALLFNAYDNLRTADEHQIPVPLLCELVGIDAKNIANLKAALLSLAKTEITWNVLDGENSKSWNFATFLSGGSIEDGICTYRYDSGLAQQLYDPEIYARINLGVIKRIRTSHALVLYENCYRFIRIGATGWWDLATFRDLMGLSDTSYKAFKDLNKYVIKPAVKEINEVSNIVLGVWSGRGQDSTLSWVGCRFGHLYSPVSRMCAQPSGEICDRSSDGQSRPSSILAVTARPR